MKRRTCAQLKLGSTEGVQRVALQCIGQDKVCTAQPAPTFKSPPGKRRPVRHDALHLLPEQVQL